MAIIRLPEPCTVSWNDMQPAEGGRFCGTCCQTVIDFTQWEPEAVLAYLRQHSGTCGRFRKDQLDRSLPEPEVFVARLNQSVLPFHSRIALLVVFVFAIMSGSCGMGAATDPSATSKEDTATKQTTGMPLMPPVPQQDTIPVPPPVKLQKIKPVPAIVTGEPAVTPEPVENLGGAPVIEEERPVVLPPDSSRQQ